MDSSQKEFAFNKASCQYIVTIYSKIRGKTENTNQRGSFTQVVKSVGATRSCGGEVCEAEEGAVLVGGEHLLNSGKDTKGKR